VTKSIDDQIQELEDKIFRAERERDAWKGKPSEHYKMASILVESLKKQLSGLVQKRGV
jgi:hypothetical protein